MSPSFEHREWSESDSQPRSLSYLLRPPAGYDAAAKTERYPLLLYLHGAGEKGANLMQVEMSVLPRTLKDNETELPFWLLCPQCPPERSGWTSDVVAALLQDVVGHLPVDTRRVYATGISMGGRGVYELAYDYSHLLAAAVPLCAFGIPNLAPRLTELPIWAFHGDQDDVLPIERGREMVQAVRDAGGKIRWSELPGDGHNIGSFVYSQPALWEWLGKQQR